MRSSQASITRYGDNGWRVRVEAGRDPRTGKRKQLSRVVRGSKRQAEKVKQELLVLAGKPSTLRDSITLGEFWRDFYMPDVENRLRPDTVSGYEAHYRQLVEGTIDAMPISKITPAVVDAWLRGIDGEKRQHQAFKILRQALNKAVRLDMLDMNPCKRVEAPSSQSDYEPDVLSLDDVAAYLDTFRGTKIEPAVLVVIGAGLRRSEVVGLDWDDVRDGSVRVDNAVTSVAGKAWDDDPKSRFGVRVVALPKSIADRLEELRGEGPLCSMGDGVRINPDNLSREYRKIQRRLPDGVKRVPLKNLRHTSLTLAVEAGVDILAVSRRGGHSNVNITSRYYLRPSRAVDEAAAAAMDDLLGK